MSRRRIARAATALAVGIMSAQAASASAATIEVVDGTAVFTAAPGEANNVRAGTLAAPDTVSLKVIDAGAPLTAGPGCKQLDANSAWCPDPLSPAPFQPLLALTVQLGDGNDRVNVDDRGTRPVTVYGDDGDDTIHFGSGEGTSPVLVGGPGDDDISTTNNGDGTPVLRGGPGADVLRISGLGGGLAYGGTGPDRLVYSALIGPGSTLQLDGGQGDDRYTFTNGYIPGAVVAGAGFDTLDQSAITSALPLFIDMATCPGCFQHVIGTSNEDQITGDDRGQVILGGEGNDAIDGRGGHDLLAGQGGDDTIAARDGTFDVVDCGPGVDAVTADRFDLVSRDCESRARAVVRARRY
jgi:Ca2+-binding RTX toxin-like protein